MTPENRPNFINRLSKKAAKVVDDVSEGFYERVDHTINKLVGIDMTTKPRAEKCSKLNKPKHS